MHAESAALISGRFRLGDLLGSGGSASVFEAVDLASTDETFDTVVALKILHPHLSHSERAREAFFVEARAAEGLFHPNVVRVLAVGVHDAEHDPLAWIALERAPGTTLAEHVESAGPLDAAQTLALADGVLRALEAAHAIGLVHRDISPANIMVEPGDDGRIRASGVRLVDFGLADAAGRPALGSDILRSAPLPDAEGDVVLGVLGSANYMSPEQALGNPVDERGDLYQLGAVLHFALTGQPPFVRDSTMAVMQAHVKAPPPVPSVLRLGVPRSVDRMIVKALLKDPAARFASAGIMRAEVVRLSGSLETPARSPGQRVAPGRTESFARTVVYRPTESAAAGVTAVSTFGRPASASASSASPSPALASASAAFASSPTFVPPGRRQRRRSGGAVWAGIILTVTVVAVSWVLATVTAPSSSTAVPPQSTSAVTPSASSVAEPTPSASPTAPSSAAPVTVDRIGVPRLVDLNLSEASSRLEALGLRLGSIATQNSLSPADTVLTSSIAEGALADAGATVDVVVASGLNAVPPVVGLRESDAVLIIQQAGFAVSKLNGQASAGTAAGVVMSSEPGQSASLRLGASVTIVVSLPQSVVAPPTEAPSTSAPPTGPPTPSPTTSGPPK